MKIKILHSKPDAALVQFADVTFAALALQYLEGSVVFGKPLHLDYAKMHEILLPNEIPPMMANHLLPEHLESSSKFRQFTLKERRYGSNVPERVIKNACRPTTVLHAANISPDVSDDMIRLALAKCGSVVAFKWLDNVEKHTEEKSNTRMALLQFATVEKATEVLMLGHNSLVNDRQVKLSFSKSSL